MAYDEVLAKRMGNMIIDMRLPAVDEKKMFGGVAFMINGNLACGVHKDRLISRVGPERYAESLAKPFAGVFDITGRPMKGWVMVSAGGFEKDTDLKTWVQMGVDFALSLPKK